MNNSYSLKLADGRWVSSPTNLATDNKAMRACFGGKYGSADEVDREGVKRRLEAVHGPLEIVENAS